MEEENREVGYSEKRPWGWFEIIAQGQSYQVKRLGVYPKKRLSLQSHNHREEHWVVARGTARVVNGEEIIVLEKSQHIFIPLGNKHRIENPEEEVLEIIETQIGDRLEEGDIVRYEDDHGRV